MKIELGLRAGVAIPLLATLILGMSILVVFNYITQVNIIKEQESRSIEEAVRTTEVFLDTLTFYHKQISQQPSKTTTAQETATVKEKTSYIDNVDLSRGLETDLKQIQKAINANVGILLNKESLINKPEMKDIKYTFGEWVAPYFTGGDPKFFISEEVIKRASQSKERYYVDKKLQFGKEFFVIYSPLKDSLGKNIGYIYIVKERILNPMSVFTMLGINIFVYIVILVLIALLIGYGMHKYVIDPLVELTKSADEISMGKTGEKIDIKNARGEIAVLAKSIERMRITMKKLLE